jgi:hypothetical protein
MHDTHRKQFSDDENLWRRETTQWRPSTKEKSGDKKPTRRFQKLDDWETESYRLKAISKHVRTDVPVQRRKHQLAKLTSGLDYDYRYQLAALNPHAGPLFAGYLDRAVQRTKTSKPAHAVTLISSHFNVDWNGRWPKLDAVQQWIADCLEGFS